MSADNETFEHIVVIDKDITINITMPKRLTAFEFKGYIKKIESLVKITAIELPPGFAAPIQLGQQLASVNRQKKNYTNEQVKDLLEIKNRSGSISEMSKMLKEKYNYFVPVSTLKYAAKKDFKVRQRKHALNMPLDEEKKSNKKQVDFTNEQVILIVKSYYADGKGIGEIREDLHRMFQLESTYKSVYKVIYRARIEQTGIYKQILESTQTQQVDVKDTNLMDFKAPDFNEL
jgi:hypothetical protein